MQASSYRSVPYSPEEQDGIGWNCNCHLANLPACVRWAIIGSILLLLAGLAAILYLVTHLDSIEGTTMIPFLLGPGLVIIAVVTVVIAIKCHNSRVHRFVKEDQEYQARLEASQNNFKFFNLAEDIPPAVITYN